MKGIPDFQHKDNNSKVYILLTTSYSRQKRFDHFFPPLLSSYFLLYPNTTDNLPVKE